MLCSIKKPKADQARNDNSFVQLADILKCSTDLLNNASIGKLKRQLTIDDCCLKSFYSDHHSVK